MADYAVQVYGRFGRLPRQLFSCACQKKRFGPLPEWVEARLSKLSRLELEDLSDRLLDAGSLNELLPR